MKIFPTVISAATPSKAERMVFQVLAGVDLGNHALGFHSVNLSEHDYKVSGEIDFVILSPRGLLVLEVKGGGVACNDGVWFYINRAGKTVRNSEGPFGQAESAMFSLHDRLAEDVDVSGLRFGYAVVTPDIRFDVNSVSWDSEIIVDGPQLSSGSAGLEDALLRIYDYWAKKISHKKGPAHIGTVQRVAELLRPSFEKVPSIAYRADALERRMESLTNQQYKLLDQVEDCRRFLCRGGAGTGKTFMLAELARRHADQGSSVLVTCASDVLCSYLRGRLPVSVDVVPFDALHVGAKNQYDVVLFDEAQDVLDFASLEVMERINKGGIEKGVWGIFYDDNLQASMFGIFDPETVTYLAEFGMPLKLSENCRNTRDIADQTKLATGGDIGFPVVGDGPPVEYGYYDEVEEQLGLLQDTLDRLIDDDVAQGHVTILSPLEFDESVVAHLPKRFKVQQLERAAAAAFPSRHITFSTIRDFKGLENRFIVLVDLSDPLRSPKDIASLYVGMTRARVGLHILLSRLAEPGLINAMKGNLPKLVGEAADGRNAVQRA